MPEEDKILNEVPVKIQAPFGKCRKCGKVIKEKHDSCRCRPYLCYQCCECGLDCNLCSCSHKKQNHF